MTILRSQNVLEKNKHYFTRNKSLESYREIDFDVNSFYCDFCEKETKNGLCCKIHGPLKVFKDNIFQKNTRSKIRAFKTAPLSVTIRKSQIKNAGFGVWAKQFIPKGSRFGPYEGVQTSKINYNGYCWCIAKQFGRKIYIDGKNPGLSNWMRYVNCSRNINEQNLAAYQEKDKIYYRTIKPIQKNEELLVDYGTRFFNQLNIHIESYFSNHIQLPVEIFKCTNPRCLKIFKSPLQFELHLKQCKKLKYLQRKNLLASIHPFPSMYANI